MPPVETQSRPKVVDFRHLVCSGLGPDCVAEFYEDCRQVGHFGHLNLVAEGLARALESAPQPGDPLARENPLPSGAGLAVWKGGVRCQTSLGPIAWQV